MDRRITLAALAAGLLFTSSPAAAQTKSKPTAADAAKIAQKQKRSEAEMELTGAAHARTVAELAKAEAELAALHDGGKMAKNLARAEAELALLGGDLGAQHWARIDAEIALKTKIASEALDNAQQAEHSKLAIADAWASKAAFAEMARAEAFAAGAAKAWGPGFSSGGGQSSKSDPALTEDQELKLMAINGLRNSSSEEAIPLLEKVLKGNEPMKLKDRALGVLAGFETAKARDVIAATARNSADRDLQLRALRYLGRMDSPATRQVMGEIYKSSTDADVKKTIIRSYHSMDDTAQIATIARSDADPEMRAYAVRHLGAQNARKELAAAYDSEQNETVKAQILRSLAAAGDHEKLTQIAKTDKDPKIRREAIRQMSAVESPAMGDTIVALYGSEQDVEVRKEALRTLARQEDVKRLVAVARAEKDPALKRTAVDYLARMRTKEANDFLLELLNK